MELTPGEFRTRRNTDNMDNVGGVIKLGTQVVQNWNTKNHVRTYLNQREIKYNGVWYDLVLR